MDIYCQLILIVDYFLCSFFLFFIVWDHNTINISKWILSFYFGAYTSISPQFHKVIICKNRSFAYFRICSSFSHFSSFTRAPGHLDYLYDIYAAQLSNNVSFMNRCKLIHLFYQLFIIIIIIIIESFYFSKIPWWKLQDMSRLIFCPKIKHILRPLGSFALWYFFMTSPICGCFHGTTGSLNC